MLINPVVVIIAAAILIFTLIYCFINNPKKPLFTGVSIAVFILLLVCTYIINAAMSTSALEPTYPVISAVAGFLSFQQSLQTQALEGSFFAYACADIVMIIICIISMVFEIKHIFTNPSEITKQATAQTDDKKPEEEDAQEKQQIKM